MNTQAIIHEYIVNQTVDVMKSLHRYLGMLLLAVLVPFGNTAMSQGMQQKISLKEQAPSPRPDGPVELSYHSGLQYLSMLPTDEDTTDKVLTYLRRKHQPIIHLGNDIARLSNRVTAATSVVKAGQLSKSRLTLNAANSLFGKLPGLMTLRNAGGNPPSSSTFYVRGKSTFRNSSPLVLIDGFERPLQSFSEMGGISVSEIQSVTVLKDAAALAKYGQRGANGAILITTKRGHIGDLDVSASYEQGVTQPKGIPSLVNGPTYARGLNEARRNDGLSPRYSQAELDAFNSGSAPYFYPNVDWFNEVLRGSGTRSNFNLSIEGGSDRAQYFVTGNFVGDNGIYGPVNQNKDYSTQSKYRRFNFRSNADIDITGDLLLQADVSANIVERNIPGGGIGTYRIFNALYSTPSGAFPIRAPNGDFGGTQKYGVNPVAELTSTGFGKPNSRQFSMTGRLKQDLSDLVPGLSAEAAVSYYVLGDFSERKTQNYRYSAISPVRDQNGNIVDTTVTTYGQNTSLQYHDSFDNQEQFTDFVGKLNYEKGWNMDNRLDATLRYHQSSRAYEGFDNVYRYENFSGNVHVGLRGKYFFDVSASYSGSNFLEPGNKFGIFPAVSAGWLISSESFMKNVDFVNRLKLRASWGLTGNDDLPTDHSYKQTYGGAGGYRFTNGNRFFGGYAEYQFPTQDYTFATSRKIDVGMEATMFQHLNLTADLFYDHRTNILTSTGGRVSEVLGNTPPQKTNGIVDNKGLDASLRWKDNIGAVSYQIGGQVTLAHNKIVNINEQFRPYDYMKRTGRQIGQSFGLEAIGFFKDQQDINNSPEQRFSDVEPGDIKYKDQNGDGIVNSYDAVPLENATGYPEVTYGVSLGVNYKGIGLSALVQGTGNYTAYLNTESVFWPLRGNNTISQYYYKNRWTPQTAGQAKYPRLTNEGNNNNFRPNSLWLVDRSYIKLRNVELSYSLPQAMLKSLGMHGATIYARGMNLFSIDDIPVLDPEQLSAGYPLMRSYSLGIELKL